MMDVGVMTAAVSPMTAALGERFIRPHGQRDPDRKDQ